MNQSTLSRANASLGFILFLLVVATLVFPRVVAVTASPESSQVADSPVELGAISLPDGEGGTMSCSSPSGFGESSSLWDCGETRVLGSSEPTPKDHETALARFYRSLVRERNADNAGVESPREGVFVKKNAEQGDETIVAVSIDDGDMTRFFSFGGAEAHQLSQRLIDAAPTSPEDEEDAK